MSVMYVNVTNVEQYSFITLFVWKFEWPSTDYRVYAIVARGIKRLHIAWSKYVTSNIAQEGNSNKINPVDDTSPHSIRKKNNLFLHSNIVIELNIPIKVFEHRQNR